MSIGNQELIRDINSRHILIKLINDGPMSRAALSKELGLTKATISAIAEELIHKFLITELGSDNTSRGRKPILLSFNPYCGYSVCVDLDNETLSIMTAHLNGENIKISHHPNNKSKKEIVSYLIKLIENQVKLLPKTPYGVIGICLAIHGAVSDNQITFTPYSSYCGIDFVSLLEGYFSIPVYLENEANLSIIGEKAFCYHYPNMVGISIHSGVGLGLILDHKLFSGYNGNAGEFGHTIVEVDGKPCPCGNQGCFEQYASERALLLEFAKRKKRPNATMKMLTSAYAAGDNDATEIITNFVKYMSIGINNILNLFNPNVIVINSSLVIEFPLLTGDMMALLKNRMREFCHLVPSALQDTSILLGCACICTKNFLGLEDFDFNFIPQKAASN